MYFLSQSTKINATWILTTTKNGVMWPKWCCYFDLAYTLSCTKFANDVCALKIKLVPAAERLFFGKSRRVKDAGNLPQSESFRACWCCIAEQCERSPGWTHQFSPYSNTIFQEMNHFGPQGAAYEHNCAGPKWDLHTTLSPWVQGWFSQSLRASSPKKEHLLLRDSWEKYLFCYEGNIVWKKVKLTVVNLSL